MVDRPRIDAKYLGASVWLVRLEGEHDRSTAPDLRRAINEVFQPGTGVVVDLSYASFVDSEILVELLWASLRVKASRDGKMGVFASSDSPAARLLDLVDANGTWFPRFESIAAATEWCGRTAAQPVVVELRP